MFGRSATRCLPPKLSMSAILTRHVPRGQPTLVQGDEDAVASYWLVGWLTDIRAAAETAGKLPEWQALVDSLVVAGHATLASYS